MADTVELRMQAECFQWYWNTYRFSPWSYALHHNDANSWNSIEGNRKKALGVIKGISDFELVIPGGMEFIELKVPGGKQSDEQIGFQAYVESCGHGYTVIFSFEEFKQKIWSIIGK